MEEQQVQRTECKLYVDLQLCGKPVPLIPALFESNVVS